MQFKFVTNNPENSFYPLNLQDIEQVEKELGLTFPNELRQFYLEIGYGFFKGSEYQINRLMDPESVRDFRLRIDDYEFYPDIEIFDEVEADKLVFFEDDESTTILIGLGEGETSPIYLFDMLIANSLKEFLEKIMEGDLYYMK
ncbi:SMI1/KNR4 family protein [Listeria booriae]|uniref:SMI1/KNR4 family protein n=1 Tax=Listeria booriae TaxID=1552123 RepID=A0A7X1A439_9LIST|nr:SMI1/KNR4 family protein [Listeria booriae]MBC2370922.1 SMI1/KNR4 family protein [Listeria booriae]